MLLIFLYTWVIAGLADTLFDRYLNAEKIYAFMGLSLEDVKYFRFCYYLPIINIIVLLFYINTYSFFKKNLK